MTIIKKIELLKKCLLKTKDINYAINVCWHGDKASVINEMMMIIDNATELFVKDKISLLDIDARNKAIQDWNNILDEKLSIFPEYQEIVKQAHQK